MKAGHNRGTLDGASDPRPNVQSQVENQMTMKKRYLSAALAALLLSLPVSVQAHCQIPCGLYDDNARVVSMLEDVATIRKAVSQIADLAGKTDPQSRNQLVRWVMNKEQHAQRIIATISDYFLTQRVKAKQSDYTERLQKHHAVIVASMRAKQNANAEVVEDLKSAVEALAPYYPPHEH